MLGSFHMLHILPLKMTFSACVWHNEFHMFTTVTNIFYALDASSKENI